MEQKTSEMPVAALDVSVLEEFRGTFGEQSDKVAQLYANFLMHAAHYIEVLRSPQQDARVSTLHTLKGSAALMGAVRIAALATSLHDAALKDPAQPSEPAIRQLQDELAMFRHALARHFTD